MRISPLQTAIDPGPEEIRLYAVKLLTAVTKLLGEFVDAKLLTAAAVDDIVDAEGSITAVVADASGTFFSKAWTNLSWSFVIGNGIDSRI